MNRQEAIAILKDISWQMGSVKRWENIEAIDMAIEALQDDWIPVSERLPEDGIAVLITTENEEVYTDQVITDPYKERYFQSNTGYDNFQVVAWMPLPEPYSEEYETKPAPYKESDSE